MHKPFHRNLCNGKRHDGRKHDGMNLLTRGGVDWVRRLTALNHSPFPEYGPEIVLKALRAPRSVEFPFLLPFLLPLLLPFLLPLMLPVELPLLLPVELIDREYVERS